MQGMSWVTISIFYLKMMTRRLICPNNNASKMHMGRQFWLSKQLKVDNLIWNYRKVATLIRNHIWLSNYCIEEQNTDDLYCADVRENLWSIAEIWMHCEVQLSPSCCYKLGFTSPQLDYKSQCNLRAYGYCIHIFALKILVGCRTCDKQRAPFHLLICLLHLFVEKKNLNWPLSIVVFIRWNHFLAPWYPKEKVLFC